jgi:hypothetical protein
VSSWRLPFVARVHCVVCDRCLDVPYGAVMATFSIGREHLGVVCDGCLSDETRDRLSARRRQMEGARHETPQ